MLAEPDDPINLIHVFKTLHESFQCSSDPEVVMKSRALLLGHPVHQMLVVFPLGLLGTSVVFDLCHIATGNPEWAMLAYWLITAGIVGALVAAPFGTVDWMAIPAGTRAKRIGAVHGLGNALVSLLFVVSWFLRSPDDAPLGAVIFSFAGAGFALVTAWLGGELVSRLGIGVYEGAGLNAPSSLHEHADKKLARTPHA
jgi:uncharacterized membrane protein